MLTAYQICFNDARISFHFLVCMKGLSIWRKSVVISYNYRIKTCRMCLALIYNYIGSIAMGYTTIYHYIRVKTMIKIYLHSCINVKSDITNSPTDIILPQGRLLMQYSCPSTYKYPFSFPLVVNSLYLISPLGN